MTSCIQYLHKSNVPIAIENKDIAPYNASTMPTKQFLSKQHIIDCLRAHYHIEVVSLTLIPLGADLNADVYKAVAKDKSSYFVKLKHGFQHDVGTTIVQLLYDSGIQSLIPSVKTIQGHSTQRIDDYILIVYPFIEGQDGFSRALTDAEWLTLGKTLRQIHDMDVPEFIKPKIRQENYSSQWRDSLRALYVHIEATPFGENVGQKFLAFMKNHFLTIQRLVDRAEQLAEMIQNDSPPLCTVSF